MNGSSVSKPDSEVKMAEDSRPLSRRLSDFERALRDEERQSRSERIWPYIALTAVSILSIVVIIFAGVRLLDQRNEVQALRGDLADARETIDAADDATACRSSIASELDVALARRLVALGHVVVDLAEQSDSTVSLNELRDSTDRLEAALEQREQTDALCNEGLVNPGS